MLPIGTILYVDDEEGDRFFMEHAFRAAGLGTSLRMVPDGRAAVNYLSGTSPYWDRALYPVPQLVLLDLNMPELPGFEVLEWIRNEAEYKDLPVVIFSGSTHPEDFSKAIALGANDFWQKPGNALNFTDVVAKLQQDWRIIISARKTPIQGAFDVTAT